MTPQQFLLSLDYELFFGCQTGSVEHCLIRPTHELAQVADKHNIHLSLFVDALYLQRLAEEARRFPRLQSDLDAIRQQLVALREQGHDIQLHLHPHWLHSSFDGEHWQLDTGRYKLHDFPAAQVASMVGSAKKVLTSLIGETVFAFRAGGWCLQPFTYIAPALQEHAIWLDSTVFAGGISDDQARWFDFSSAPVKDFWYFDDDPTRENQQGAFLEVPISALRVTPNLFWRMALTRKFMANRHKPLGDGSSLSWNRSYYQQRLTSPTISVVSIDGLKAGLLGRALRAEQKAGKQLFHAMGHPKAVTRHSLERLDSFFTNIGAFTNITFQDFRSYQPKKITRKSIIEG